MSLASCPTSINKRTPTVALVVIVQVDSHERVLFLFSPFNHNGIRVHRIFIVFTKYNYRVLDILFSLYNTRIISSFFIDNQM